MIQMGRALETAELLAFTRVVEAKTVSRAAVELDVPRATIGRRLARLEERLGVRLLRRSTRSIALTDAGELFYRNARIALEALANAENSVRTNEASMRGNLRVSVPPMLAPSFREMVFGFVRRYPDVRVQLEFSTRIVDLLREGFDVALRATAEIEPGLIARTVARQRLVAVASPGYLAKHGAPRTIKELAKHRCLTGFARGELPQSSWKMNRRVVQVQPAFSSNDVAFLRDGAIDGVGIAMVPEVLVADAIERGTLVRVLPHVLESENVLAVVHPEREFLPAHVRAFIDALVEWAPTLHRPERSKRAR